MAALHDWAFRTIPNWIPGFLGVQACLIHVVHSDLLRSAGIGALIFAGALILWLHGLMGGGDVKLMAATGFLLPAEKALLFIFLLSILGGMQALVYLLLSLVMKKPGKAEPHSSYLTRIMRAEHWRIASRAPLPYAMPIAGAACILFI